jgi:hypothetical protein
MKTTSFHSLSLPLSLTYIQIKPTKSNKPKEIKRSDLSQRKTSKYKKETKQLYWGHCI